MFYSLGLKRYTIYVLFCFVLCFFFVLGPKQIMVFEYFSTFAWIKMEPKIGVTIFFLHQMKFFFD